VPIPLQLAEPNYEKFMPWIIVSFLGNGGAESFSTGWAALRQFSSKNW
jgi:hypothetical protein